ncbi:MAG: hypothetical protein HC895_18215 [Leptolyngbyaceae cyanobacterium SM1_3_5]|nr:hypothetical protein [Leptolyngbyaceae cyanobacterium SM1_3_5]
MNHEDTMTLGAFLTAATRLETPLPENLQHQLDTIAEQFPDSIYELHEFVEQYNPLKQQYITALQALPSEGERLKFADASEAEVPLQELTVSWEEVELQLGAYFTDMVLDLVERSHPAYDSRMAEALTSALPSVGQSSGMTSEEFNVWLTQVFNSSDEEL